MRFPDPEDPHPPYGRTAHPYFLHDMIRSQPGAIDATVRSMAASTVEFPRPSAARGPLFVGMGTSFHAALATAWAAGRDGDAFGGAVASDAFELLLGPETIQRAGVAVVFSSSGETALTLEAQRALRAARVPQILVSGTPESRSAALADHLLRTEQAVERAWVHTVSYTTAVAAAIALLGRWRGTPDPGLAEAGRLAGEVVAREVEWKALAEQLRDRRKILLLGSGSAAATAREAALKLREGAGRFVAAAGVEEFLHGILPSVDERTGVLAIATTPPERERAETALAAAARAGARTVLLARGAAPAQGTFASLPAAPPAIAPIVDIVPFQFLTYWMAVGEGRNPDVMGYDDPRIFAARRTYGI